MGKKIKLGTIKLTRKVTVTQQVRQQRRVDINPTYLYHFCRAFKERIGITPTQYAKQNKTYRI